MSARSESAATIESWNEGDVEGFLDAFARLFVACTIYPSIHPRVRKLAEVAFDRLPSPVLAGKVLRIDLVERSFEVDGTPLLRPSGPVERVRANMDSLALASLSFDSACTAESLTSLAAALQDAVKLSIRGSLDLEGWSAALPSGVSAQREDFGLPGFGEGSESSPSRPRIDAKFKKALVEQALRPLRDQDISPALLERLNRFVTELLDTTAKLVTGPDSNPLPASTNAEDILALCSEALGSAVRVQLDQGEEDLDLDGLFGDVQQFLAGSMGQELALEVLTPLRSAAQDLLDSHFRLEKPVVTPLARRDRRMPAAAAPSDRFTPTIEEWIARHPDMPGALVGRPNELFSISVRCARRNPELLATPAFQRRLLLSLEQNLDAGPTRPFLRAIDELLRDSSIDGALILALSAASCARNRPGLFPRLLGRLYRREIGRDRIWPLAAMAALLEQNEVESLSKAGLVELIRRRATDAEVENLARFIQASGSTKLVWREPSPCRENWSIFEAVLRCRALQEWHATLMRGFFQRPPTSPTAVACVLFRESDPNARPFMIGVLEELLEERPLPTIRMEASRRITRFLRSDEPQNIRLESARRLLQALGFLGSAEAKKFLESVLERKRSLFRAYYPAEWRSEAEAALKLSSQLARPSDDSRLGSL